MMAAKFCACAGRDFACTMRIMELSPAVIAVMCLAAFTTGISKSGLPGLVTVVTPIIAMTMPSRMASGILLPILIAADIVSVIYWRRKAAWKWLGWIIPGATGGLVIGYFLLRNIDDDTFKPILGVLIILVTLLSMTQKHLRLSIDPENKVIPLAIGLFAGICNMLANAAAPVLAMYLLAIDMDKEDFVGTNAWFFLITNTAKLPFSLALGTVSVSHLGFDALIFPLALAGGAAGIYFLKKIPQNAFNIFIKALALVAGAGLLL